MQEPMKSSESGMKVSDRKGHEMNMENRLRELGAKIDEWGEKAQNAKEQMSLKYHALKEKQAEAYAKLQSMKESSAEAWSEFKLGEFKLGEFKLGMYKAMEELIKAWNEIKAGSSRAASKFEKE